MTHFKLPAPQKQVCLFYYQLFYFSFKNIQKGYVLVMALEINFQ